MLQHLNSDMKFHMHEYANEKAKIYQFLGRGGLYYFQRTVNLKIPKQTEELFLVSQ